MKDGALSLPATINEEESLFLLLLAMVVVDPVALAPLP
jgi:hypothetical protein